MTKKHWTMIVPGAVLLCASPALGSRTARRGSSRAQHQSGNPPGGRQPRGDPGRARAGPGAVVSARFGRRLGRRSQPAQPDPAQHRHRRRDAVADRRPADRRPAAVRQRRPRGGNPPPGRAHRRRRGARRGALRIRRAQRRAHLHRLSAAAAAGGDRAGQCDLPRAARRRPARRRLQGLDQHRRPAAGRRAAAIGARPGDRGPRGPRYGGDHVPDADRHSDRQRVDAARPVAVHARDRLPEAEELARQNNPRVQEAIADLDTAREDIRAAQCRAGSALQPRRPRPAPVTTSTASQGKTTDLQARVVLRWNMFNGGTKEANVREQQAPRRRSPCPPVRADPRRPRRTCARPGAGCRTRAAWSASWRPRAASPTTCCCPIASSSTSAAVRCSTCSTRRTRATTSRRRPRRPGWPRLYAQYRVLAATNRLIEALGVHDADRGV